MYLSVNKESKKNLYLIDENDLSDSESSAVTNVFYGYTGPTEPIPTKRMRRKKYSWISGPTRTRWITWKINSGSNRFIRTNRTARWRNRTTWTTRWRNRKYWTNRFITDQQDRQVEEQEVLDQQVY